MQAVTTTIEETDTFVSNHEAVIVQVLKLEQDLAAARKSATEALLQERRCIDAALQKIGYDAGGASAPKKSSVVRVCAICGESGHNARKHKSDAPPTSDSRL